MTENKRYVALPETVSYKDTATDEILCLKVEKDYYEVLSLLNHFHDAWFDVQEDLEQIRKEYDELHEEKEILEVQLRSANNEIDKLVSEINMLTDTCHDCCKEIREENRQLKYKNEILSDELEQCKAVINKKWSEYLKKKME